MPEIKQNFVSFQPTTGKLYFRRPHIPETNTETV